MSIIDPEEGHFNDVDGGGAAAASDGARSTGLPIHSDDAPSSERAQRRPSHREAKRDQAGPDAAEPTEPQSPDDIP